MKIINFSFALISKDNKKLSEERECKGKWKLCVPKCAESERILQDYGAMRRKGAKGENVLRERESVQKVVLSEGEKMSDLFRECMNYNIALLNINLKGFLWENTT